MICTEILGNIRDFDTAGRRVETVDIEWSDANKKIHRRVTSAGEEIGIRMDDSVLTKGLYDGDVIYADEDRLIVVRTPACPVIAISIEKEMPQMIAKVCYEIGNRHAPLFYGDDLYSFVTPYNEPMLVMLRKIPHVKAQTVTEKLNFEHRISTSAHHHHHESEEHDHHHEGEG